LRQPGWLVSALGHHTPTEPIERPRLSYRSFDWPLTASTGGKGSAGFLPIGSGMRVTIGIKIFGIAVGLLILMAVVALFEHAHDPDRR
jgi:hypothetical protein